MDLLSTGTLREFKQFNGILYFAPHEKSKRIQVSSIEDDIPEPDTNFVVRILDVTDRSAIGEQAIVDTKNDSFVFKGNRNYTFLLYLLEISKSFLQYERILFLQNQL